MLKKLVWLGLVLLLACADEVPPTQVVIIIDAESAVRAQATGLSLVITDVTGGAERVVNDDSAAPVERHFPHRLLLMPTDNDATRVYRLEAKTSGSQGELSVARLISSYVAQQTRYVKVVLEDACIGKVCSRDQTCSLGLCVDAERSPSEFAQDEALAPVSTQVPASTDLPEQVIDAQVSLPEAPDAAPAAQSEPDAGPAKAQDDAGLTPNAPDAGPAMSQPDAGPATPTDAGTTPPKSDAGSMPTKPDAGVTPAKPDAGTTPPKPDAGTGPKPPDAGTMPSQPDAGVQNPYAPCVDLMLLCFDTYDMWTFNPQLCYTCNNGKGCQGCAIPYAY